MNRLAALMWRSPKIEVRVPEDEAAIARLLRRLYAGGRISLPQNCLERSLLAYRLLSELNADPILVVALSAKERATHGHAWVVVDDSPVAEPADALTAMTPVVAFGRRGAVLPFSTPPESPGGAPWQVQH
jgi:hypothetical protein